MQKKYFYSVFLFLLFVFENSSAQLTYIPDDAFEQKLIDMGHDDVLDDYVLTSNISDVTFLNLAEKGIVDLTGIEDFSGLTELLCHNNSLNKLDVTANTELKRLLCFNNQLTNLDVSQNSKLEELFCDGNQISNIDIRKNKKLLKFKCDGNPISKLEISLNTLLTSLYINNMLLTNIDLSKNALLSEIYCGNNELRQLNLSQNKVLTKLYCSNNKLEILQVNNQNNSLITYFKSTGNPDLHCIEVDDPSWSAANWTNIDSWTSFSKDCLSYEKTYLPNRGLESFLFDCGYDDVLDGYVLTSNILSVTSMSFPFDGGGPGSINGKQSPSPDFESWGDLSGLEHFISLENFYAGGFYDETLDWSSLINLKKLNLEEAWGLKKIILNNSLELQDLSIEGANKLIEFDLSNNLKLEKLNITAVFPPYGLTSLDLSKNSEIIELNLLTFVLSNLNLKNGNNRNINSIEVTSSNLTCFQVDDVDWSSENWDSQYSYSADCYTFLNDSDKDGIPNDDDLCLDTPIGETVNDDGCSDSQLDEDSDGVTDDKDTCPDTPSGEIVDINGCSGNQALSVADQTLEKEIKLFPNPVSNILSIITENTIIEKVEIYSYLGIKLDDINHDFESMSTDKLSNGFYFVKISSEKGSTIKRFIKVD